MEPGRSSISLSSSTLTQRTSLRVGSVPGSSLPPGSTQYGSLSGFWWRTRSSAPSRSTTAATRTPKSILRAARSLPMQRVYPREDQGELRDVRRLFLLALGQAQVQDLGLQLVACFEHQAQTFVFGEMSVVGFEDTGLGGWVISGRTAVVKEDGEPFVLYAGELQDRVQVGGYGLVARSSGNRRVEQLPTEMTEARHPQHVSRKLEIKPPVVRQYFEAIPPDAVRGAEDHGRRGQRYLGVVAVHAAQLQRSLAVEAHRVPGRSEKVPARLGEVAPLHAGPVHGAKPGF